jgi:hypothetical protein
MTYVVLRCAEIAEFFTSLVKKSVKNCTKMQHCASAFAMLLSASQYQDP